MITVLYKKAKNGKTQEWSIIVEDNRFQTSEGFVDGVKSATEWTICKGKRIGASNETTPQQQALKEAEAKVKKQKDKGWTENIEDIEAAAPKIKPMLAHKWEDHQDYMMGPGTIASQPKLDGMRCIATHDGLFTRNGKPIVTVPHIWKEVKELLDGCPAGTKIDGELYNHDLKEDFNKIISVVKKQKPSAEDFEESKKYAQYHIYDIDMPGSDSKSFAMRTSVLKQLLTDCVVNGAQYLHYVSTTFIFSQEELDNLYGLYLSEGYEGQMVRKGASSYSNSRTKDLLKRKEFKDEEFEIIDIEEGVGNRSGMMGRIKFKHFDSNARGTHEYFRELLLNKDKYIGKMATVRYQNLTPDGIPRFPVMTAIRDYE